MTMTDQALVEALREIEEAEGGRLTPKAVVDRARDQDSPLHHHFEWDDAAAAQAHREDTARALIRRVKVVEIVQTETYKYPAYLRDPSLPPGEQGYRSLIAIRKNEDDAHRALCEEMARAAAVLDRAKRVARGLGLEAEVTKIEDMVKQFRDELQTEQQPTA